MIEIRGKKNHPFTPLNGMSFFDPEKEVSSIDILTLNNIFCVVSKRRRGELEKVSEINSKRKIDIPIVREFRTMVGFHCVVSGPLLCQYDATVASILLALYFELDGSNGNLVCNYSDIAEKLYGKRHPSGKLKDDISRSLTRLKGCNIQIMDDDSDEFIWQKSIIKDLSTNGKKSRGFKFIIELNEYFVPALKKQQFSLQGILELISLSGEYQPALYRLVTSSEHHYVELSLDDLYCLVTEKGSTSKNGFFRLESTTKSYFKKNIANSIEGLKKRNILTSESKICGDTVILKKVLCETKGQ